jgi:hypothetical protein
LRGRSWSCHGCLSIPDERTSATLAQMTWVRLVGQSDNGRFTEHALTFAHAKLTLGLHRSIAE